MIDLKNVTALDILPDVLRKDTKVIAASYAMNHTAKMILSMIEKTSVYALVDVLPEKLVDLLALEFRAQYYIMDAALEEKREAVKKALLWYKKAGTASVVMELCEFLYGKSIVWEWFDYNGRPYTFKLEMLEESRLIDTAGINNFILAVKKVKNTRSLLEALIFHRKATVLAHSGAATTSYTRQAIIDFFIEEAEEELMNHAAGKTNEAFKRQVIVDFEKAEAEISYDLESNVVLIQKKYSGGMEDGNI
ncbi:MAG: phage tail protein [Lachnospiraceae bacterium]|nr:phage tail protein [Lachnospiraceae bacterium]